MYACSATIVYDDAEGWTHTCQTPTFYLDETVQGIVNEAHAEAIAVQVVDPTGTFGINQIHVTAVKL
jgi:hypothetical protein